MIHEIAPHRYDNIYNKQTVVEDEDYILIFIKNQVFMKKDNNEIYIPKYKDLKNTVVISHDKLIYLFKIDNMNFFMLKDFNEKEYSFLTREDTSIFRTLKPQWAAFGGITGKHLYDWYSKNRYCSVCGNEMEIYNKERALCCKSCNNILYPSIAPAVIVGVINKDKILLTRYSRGNYRKYALVAGYVEVGESVEDTVKREVMEEVGLKVKNLRYFGSQPWGFSNTLLMGFFADLDGDEKITLEEEELAEGTWFRYDELPERDLLISLTQTMINEFENKLGNV